MNFVEFNESSDPPEKWFSQQTVLRFDTIAWLRHSFLLSGSGTPAIIALIYKTYPALKNSKISGSFLKKFLKFLNHIKKPRETILKRIASRGFPDSFHIYIPF